MSAPGYGEGSISSSRRIFAGIDPLCLRSDEPLQGGLPQRKDRSLLILSRYAVVSRHARGRIDRNPFQSTATRMSGF